MKDEVHFPPIKLSITEGIVGALHALTEADTRRRSKYTVNLTHGPVPRRRLYAVAR